MKFSGELKFPEIDHPGVPVTFVIEESQAELVVEGESLGRWSLYDIHARRLVASAFQLDLEGIEVTFVADDPVDFAYRGVEHMAETWATFKTMRMARRPIAVRRSRRGTTPSRIGEMMTAMEANLDAQSKPRQIAGEDAMPEIFPPEADPVPEPKEGIDWDTREAGSIPLASDAVTEEVEPFPESASTPEKLSEGTRRLEEEKKRLAQDRAAFEEERLLAEQREADRVEAYRLEMQRLEAEREELRHEAVQTGQVDAPPPQAARTEPEDEIEPEPEEEVESHPAPPVLDLNDLEDEPGLVPALDADAPVLRPQPQAQLATADAGTERSGGLMGAVRAAFRSSARDHDHQFIEAPGGIGITRYVCEECGFVSISG